MRINALNVSSLYRTGAWESLVTEAVMYVW